ncbi:MAG: TPM domain-containing protein [Ruminococcus sp.]|nr:TPM domain-containing protein [Ruminococcus sp.]
MIKKASKRILSLAAVLVMLLSFTLPVFAAETQNHALRDDAGLFTNDAATLEGVMEEIGAQTGWQIIVHTSYNGIDADNMEDYYNDVYYDSQSFQPDSVMLVIDRGTNNRIILTHGDAMYYFSDERMSEIKSNMRPYLNNDDMLGATYQFLQTTRDFYNEGKPEDGSFSNVELNEKRDNPFMYNLSHRWWIFSLIGLGVGGISAGGVVGRYHYNGKLDANYKLHENSKIDLTEKEDIFVTTHTTVTRIQTESQSSGSSGGGGGGGGGSSHGSSGSF